MDVTFTAIKPFSRAPRHASVPFLLVLCLAGLFAPRAAAQSDVITTAQRDVAVLASDSLKGRGYWLGGHLKAAGYIRARFLEIGLEPIGRSYFQNFSLSADVFLDAPQLALNGSALEPGIDFLPYPSSASGSLDTAAPVVRASSGLYLPRQGINDYAGKEVEGAVVVLDASVPDSLRTNPAIAPAYLLKDARVEIARRLGARAVIFLEDALVFGGSGQNAAIPAFEVLRRAWPGESASLSYRIRGIQNARFASQNVIGIVRGHAVPDSFLIVSAHYDHLGSLGDEIFFPGANDNASGTAMLLGTAEQVARNPLRYSVLFVAFSGEEAGLIGSHYFAENPPVELARVRLMLNFDMVASGQDGIVAVGGVDNPALFSVLQQVNEEAGAVPLAARRNAPNSDHYWLTQKGVPALYLYTSRGAQPYHHVQDRPETLEWDDFHSVFELSARFLDRIAR